MPAREQDRRAHRPALHARAALAVSDDFARLAMSGYGRGEVEGVALDDWMDDRSHPEGCQASMR